jgi:hypothetical protein
LEATTTRGEYVGWGGRGAIGYTDTPGSEHLHHLAAGIGAHHDGAGRCGHDHCTDGHHPQHHGSQRHGPHHDQSGYPGPDHPAALT